MKKIVVLIASVAFMASSAFANVATLAVVETAIKSASSSSKALSGINAGVITAATAANPSLSSDLDQFSADIKAVAESSDDAVNGMSKIERMDMLVDLYTAAVLTKDNYSVVERLFMGKPYKNLTGQKVDEDDKLEAGNLAQMKQFLAEYKDALKAGDSTVDAAEKASQSVTKHSFADFLEKCGAKGARR